MTISGATPTSDIIQLLAAETDETASPLDLITLEVEQLARRLNAAEEIDPVPVIAVCERFELLASDAGDQLRVERALTALLGCYTTTGNWTSSEKVTVRLRQRGSAAAARTARLVRSAIAVHGNLPFDQSMAFLGMDAITENERLWLALLEATAAAATDPDGSRDAVDAVLEAGAGLGDLLLVHNALGIVHHLRGDLDDAIRHYERMAEIYRDAGSAAFASTYLGQIAALRLDRGDPPDEVHPLLSEAASCTSPYDVMSVALNSQVACVLAAREGRLDDAREQAARGLRTIDRIDGLWSRADLRRQVSELPRLTGDEDEERRLLSEALDLYRRKGIAYWAQVCEERLAELG